MSQGVIRANHPRSVTAVGTIGHSSSFSVISPELEEIITANDIERMAQGNQVIFLTEAVTYRDIFGKGTSDNDVRLFEA